MSTILDELSCFQEIRLQIWNQRLKKPDMANFLSNQTRSSYFDHLLAILNHCRGRIRGGSAPILQAFFGAEPSRA